MAGVTGEVPDDWPEDEEPDADTLLYHEVYPYATHRPRPTVGRNDRCPCGSGKKYKACHLGTESFPLEDRAPWLSDKVLRFARSRPHVMDTVGALADDIAGSDDQASYALGELALRHRSRAARGRAVRGVPRRPQRPAPRRRSTHRGAVGPHRSIGVRGRACRQLDARPPRRGDRRPDPRDEHDVVRPDDLGMLLVGRPVPVADTYRVSRDSCRSTAATSTRCSPRSPIVTQHGIADVLGRQFRPRRMTNTEGHDMVLHTVRWQLDRELDLAAVRESFERHGLDVPTTTHRHGCSPATPRRCRGRRS